MSTSDTWIHLFRKVHFFVLFVDLRANFQRKFSEQAVQHSRSVTLNGTPGKNTIPNRFDADAEVLNLVSAVCHWSYHLVSKDQKSYQLLCILLWWWQVIKDLIPKWQVYICSSRFGWEQISLSIVLLLWYTHSTAAMSVCPKQAFNPSVFLLCSPYHLLVIGSVLCQMLQLPRLFQLLQTAPVVSWVFNHRRTFPHAVGINREIGWGVKMMLPLVWQSPPSCHRDSTHVPIAFIHLCFL